MTVVTCGLYIVFAACVTLSLVVGILTSFDEIVYEDPVVCLRFAVGGEPRAHVHARRPGDGPARHVRTPWCDTRV